MNKASAYRITNVSLFKNYIFGALILYTTGTLQNAIIIHLGCTILLARRWRVRHKLLSVHLAPVHLSTGKGPTGTFNAGGALDGFNPHATSAGVFGINLSALVPILGSI